MDRAPVFNCVRHMLGRGFSQNEVDDLDTALDTLLAKTANNPETPNGIMDQDSVPSVPHAERHRVSPRGIALIKRFEGCARLRKDGLIEAYPDPGTGGKPWTIGWGATGLDLDGVTPIGPNTVWTRKQCDDRLSADLIRYADDVLQAIGTAPTTQNQFDALVSFHYNTGAIRKATLTRHHRAGDFAGAAKEFSRWVYAGKRKMKGLIRRRAAEAALYQRQ